MISPPVALFFSIIYSIFLADISTIYISYFLPIIFALYFRKHELFKIFKQLALLNIFFGLIFLSLILSGALINEALVVVIRGNLMVLLPLLLFFGIDIYRIIDAMERLNFPKIFVAISFFSIKFFELLLKEYKKHQMSLILRGFAPKTDLFTYKTYAYLLGMIILRGIERGKKLQRVMILRGYKNEIYFYNHEKFNLFDIVFSVLVVLALTLNFGVIL